MTYVSMGNIGMGAYYEYAPHQVFGSYYEFVQPGTSGFGAFGEVDFVGAEVWSNWLAGQGCSAQNPSSCEAARQAVDTIRAALMQLGYGQLTLGQPWGSKDIASYKAFTTDHNLQSSGGMPSQSHMAVFEQLVSQGSTPGPQPPIAVQKVGTTFVQTPTTARAGLGGLLTVGLLGLAVVGGIAVVAKRKKRRR